MATPGKSKRPPPFRDARLDSTPPAARREDIAKSNVRPSRPSRDGRFEPDTTRSSEFGSGSAGATVERLRAERASDADALAAMLVRVAESERARDAAERRATGLENWTVELEAKVAEARTRADELAAKVAASVRNHATVRLPAATTPANAPRERDKLRIAELEEELSRVKREHEDALEVERVKHSLDLETLRGQQRGTLPPTRDRPVGGLDTAREAMAKAVAMIENLEKQEAQSSAVRLRILEQAKRVLGDVAPVRGATLEATVERNHEAEKAGTLTMPPLRPGVPVAMTGPKKRSRRPPPPPSARTVLDTLDTNVVSFEDVDLDE